MVAAVLNLVCKASVVQEGSQAQVFRLKDVCPSEGRVSLAPTPHARLHGWWWSLARLVVVTCTNTSCDDHEYRHIFAYTGEHLTRAEKPKPEPDQNSTHLPYKVLILFCLGGEEGGGRWPKFSNSFGDGPDGRCCWDGGH